MTVTDAAGRTVFSDDVPLVGAPRVTHRPRHPPPAHAAPPGLYHAAVEVPGATTHPLRTTTGFWVRDEKLLASGPRLTVTRDWLRRDGQVFPLVGTTYMASDVHRKFLFEPNPHVWDRDFAEMKRQGINFVRTGLWTAQGRLMLDPGAIDEAALSALDAFVLTAARHGIPVCFNFFAFLPPAFTAANPYLDPRALEGQREILTLFASRYRGVSWIHWDLINEPSYAPPHGTLEHATDPRRPRAPRVHGLGQGPARRRPARPARAVARHRRRPLRVPARPGPVRRRSCAKAAVSARDVTSRSSPTTPSRPGRRDCGTCCGPPGTTRS